MHHIYHTEGIILGSRNSKESDKFFYIFTRDLGMIYANATGVRKMSSKLRFILQDFAYVKVDLVQGKNIFRVTSASKTNLLGEVTKRPETLRIFHNIARLLKRLLAGVEPNEALFADLLHSLTILEEVAKKEPARTTDSVQSGGDIHNIEAIIVLRILNNLGYIGDNENLKDLIKSPFEASMLFEVSKSRSHILSQINKALKETHL